MSDPAKVHTLTADDLIPRTDSPAPSPIAPDNPPPPARTETPAPAPSPAVEGNPFAGVVDAIGREFHPAKFRLKDGQPQRDSRGWFVPLGLGRSAGSEPAQDRPAPSFIPPDDPAPAAPGVLPVDQMAAEVAINLVQTALILIGQDEGVLTDFERNTLRGPLARILAKYNLGDKMTPELEFAAALAVIVMTRLQKPKTMGWFQEKMFALKNWWTRGKLARVVHNPTLGAERPKPAPGPAAAADYLERHGAQ